MRLAVLGATSRTGLLLLGQAAERGHGIVAFTRRPQDLPATTPPITAVRDGLSVEAMRAALTRVDGVISLLPGGNRHNPHLASDTIHRLITAMTERGVKRLVVVSAYPLVADRPRVPVWILRRLLAVPYADIARMEQLVSESGLDWTVWRCDRSPRLVRRDGLARQFGTHPFACPVTTSATTRRMQRLGYLWTVAVSGSGL